MCLYVTNELPAKPHRPGHRQRYRTDTNTDTGIGIDTGIDIDIYIDKSKSKSRSQKPYVKSHTSKEKLHFIFKPLCDL